MTAPRVAGRALDAEIAEKVFGLRCVDDPPGSGRNCPVHSCDFYSTDIAAAWEVVEKMRADRGLSCVIGMNGCAADQNGVKFIPGYRTLGHSIFAGDDVAGWDAVDTTIPLAICRAALAAVEGSDA